jgi:hypothetical protein
MHVIAGSGSLKLITGPWAWDGADQEVKGSFQKKLINYRQHAAMSSETETSASSLGKEVLGREVLSTAGKDLAVSALSAALAHAMHHPLYTLKSQMMYYGPQFNYRLFLRRSWTEKAFLFRGMGVIAS